MYFREENYSPQLYSAKDLQNIMTTAGVLKKVQFDAFVCSGTSGFGMAVLLSAVLQKPLLHVRSNNEHHGCQNEVIGYINENSRYMFVDDHVSSGSTFQKCYDAVKEISGTIVSIFLYSTSYGYKDDIIKERMSPNDRTLLTHLFDYTDEQIRLFKKYNVVTEASVDGKRKWELEGSFMDTVFEPVAKKQASFATNKPKECILVDDIQDMKPGPTALFLGDEFP